MRRPGSRHALRLLVGTAIAMICLSSPGHAQSARIEVSAVRLDPAPPETLEVGRKVSIGFRYRLATDFPCRIFVRPLHRGDDAEGYAVSGSPLYQPGTGSGHADFTLRSPGAVDQLLIVVVPDHRRDRPLFEDRVEAVYRFTSGDAPARPTAQAEARVRDQRARVRDHRVEDRGEDRVEVRAASESDRVAAVKQTRERPDITRRVPTELLDRLGQYRPPVWRPLPDQDEDTPPPADGPPPCNELEVEPRQCEDVAGRRITEDGMVIVDCADGSTWRTKPSGGDVFTTPDGISCRELELFALRKGTALPPAEPPSGMSAAQWAEQVNFWLSENVSHYLLFRIQSLVGDQYFDRYQSLEAEDAHNLYQRIDYRLAFLEKLMEQ